MFERTTLNTGTTEVRPGFELPVAALEAWLSDNVEDYSGPLTLRQFRGGQSNPTYRLDTPAQSYVLRRKPSGALIKSAHAVDREHRVMTALADCAVPVPRTFGLCQDESVIGTEFFLMECVEGRVFWDLLADGSEPEIREKLWNSAIDALAELHHLNPNAVSLGDYGRGGNYVERQVGRWSAQYAKTRSAVHNPSLDRLIDWLPERIPASEPQSLIHGDFQFSNMVFHPTEPRLVAVLDWELSTLGNPLSDLAYFCRVFHLPEYHGGLLGLNREAQGIPAERDLLARYAAKTGLQADDWEFYIVFALFRLAAIRQGVAQRVVDGTAASAHARQVGDSAVPIADAAWQLACAVS